MTDAYHGTPITPNRLLEVLPNGQYHFLRVVLQAGSTPASDQDCSQADAGQRCVQRLDGVGKARGGRRIRRGLLAPVLRLGDLGSVATPGRMVRHTRRHQRRHARAGRSIARMPVRAFGVRTSCLAHGRADIAGASTHRATWENLRRIDRGISGDRVARLAQSPGRSLECDRSDLQRPAGCAHVARTSMPTSQIRLSVFVGGQHGHRSQPQSAQSLRRFEAVGTEATTGSLAQYALSDILAAGAVMRSADRSIHSTIEAASDAAGAVRR